MPRISPYFNHWLDDDRQILLSVVHVTAVIEQ